MELNKCPLCESAFFSKLMTSKDNKHKLPGKFNIVRCITCSFVYINPQPIKIKEYYPRTYGAYNTSASINKRAIMKDYRDREKIVLKYLNCGDLLDYGCGDGSFLKFMEGKGFNCFGIEPYNRKFDVGTETIISKKIDELMSRKINFDVITMWHSLEHIPAPISIIRKLESLLKPNGYLIICVPNFNSFQRFLFGKWWYNLDTPRHLNLFTPSTLKKAVVLNTKLKYQNIFFNSGITGFTGSLSFLLKRNHRPQSENDSTRQGNDKNILVALVGSFFYLICKIIDVLHWGDIMVAVFKKQ